MKKWQLQSKTVVTDKNQLLAVLLKNRHITEQKSSAFFQAPHPKTWQLSQLGFSQRAFNKIKKRLLLAKKNQEKVYIFGDYDSDGICASVVLWEGLKFFGITSLPFIPNRQEHGYGLSIKALKDLFASKGKADLLITVDNGIVALPALEYLANEGVEVIVTDHHQADKQKLPVLASFHSTKMCGAAVAWFLLNELFKSHQDQKQADNFLNELLSLVAIATVTDLMPLQDLNRSLVVHGLLALQKTDRPGLLALYQLAGINKAEISSYHLGYVIGPRINAMGRLADSMDAVRLLCTNNDKRAKQLAHLLQDTNVERQDLTNDLILQAEASLSEKAKKASLIIVDGEYHEGIIGLLAGKLSEKFLKPCVVISVPANASDKKLVIKASARSLPGFNITDFLRQVENDLLSVGGHPLAAGFSLNLEKLESVKKKLLTLAKKQLSNISLKPQIRVDCPISSKLLNLDCALALEAFEPYGNTNPRPVFLLENLLLNNFKNLGKDNKHAKLFFSTPESKQEIVVLAWRFQEQDLQFTIGQKFDLLVTLAINSWKNNKQLQINLLDIREKN
ncbi:MAG: single-stranded-DNA-specific exonuclease RecJ [Candidatus Pacebacteria bacterium]|nr:single-stranded-DNA-specific exonuclease RecJ [Candidatus Paceibacterota bacterium]